MTMPIPNDLARHEGHKPIVALLSDRLVAPKALAERWGYTVDHLANLRRAKHGLPWIRLPLGPKEAKGGIRYRLSDVIAAEIDGYFGQVTLPQVELAIAGCPALTKEQGAAVLAHLRTALGSKTDPAPAAVRPPHGRRGRPKKSR